MKQDKELTRVIYRKFKNGEIIALFPQIKETNYCVLSYMHVGQHGSADFDQVVRITKLALADEYKELHNELTNQVGYTLDVRTRNNRR